MASLRDDENLTNDYSSPDDEFSGATLPGSIAKWAKGVGSDVIFSSMGLTSVSHSKVLDLNSYVSPDNHVAVLIHHGLLTGQSGSMPTHWILWNGKVTIVNTGLPINDKVLDSDLVDLSLFSWGEVKTISEFCQRTWTFSDFCSYIYGAVVFKKIK